MSSGSYFLLYPQHIFDTLILVKSKKFIPYLLVGIVGILISAAYIFAIDPEENFLVFDFSLSPIPILFSLLFISASSLCVYGLKNVRRGILVGVFLEGIVLLRFFELNNGIYPILLIIILTLIEFMFFKRST